eukprot:1910339-Pyramimonas_sp.AAC.1
MVRREFEWVMVWREIEWVGYLPWGVLAERGGGGGGGQKHRGVGAGVAEAVLRHERLCVALQPQLHPVLRILQPMPPRGRLLRHARAGQTRNLALISIGT